MYNTFLNHRNAISVISCGEKIANHLVMYLVHIIQIQGLLFILSFTENLHGIFKFSDTIFEHNDLTHLRITDFQILRFLKGVTNLTRFS